MRHVRGLHDLVIRRNLSVIRCPKSLLNGPCGGAVEGKCEVDERLCAWDKIFERLKELGKLENIENIHEPKDHMKKGRVKKT